MKVTLDVRSIRTIESILNRGKDVEVRRKKDGVVVLEVQKEIKAAPA